GADGPSRRAPVERERTRARVHRRVRPHSPRRGGGAGLHRRARLGPERGRSAGHPRALHPRRRRPPAPRWRRFRAGLPPRQTISGREELAMHPRLRRQLAMLRSDLPPAFRKLISVIDRAYREADTERAELEESLVSMIALLHRTQSRALRARRRKQERLKKVAKAHRRLERVLEKSRLALFELTADLVVRWAKRAAASLCGTALEELPGKRIVELLQPVAAAEVSETWSRALRRAEPVSRTPARSAPVEVHTRSIEH